MLDVMPFARPLLETPRPLLGDERRDELKTPQNHWNHTLDRQFLLDDKPIDEDPAEAGLGTCLSASPQGHDLCLFTGNGSYQLFGCVALFATSVAAQYEPRLFGHLEPMVSHSPDHWGHGFSIDGLAAVHKYAFEHLTFPSLAAVNDVLGTASEKMPRRFGVSVHIDVERPKYGLQTWMLQCRAPRYRDDAQSVTRARAQWQATRLEYSAFFEGR